VLARCQLRLWSATATDAVFALLDVNVETEALGSRLRFPGTATRRWSVRARAALRRGRLAVPDPAKAGRMPVALEAARTAQALRGRGTTCWWRAACWDR
jgi:hypothetical protein